MSTLTSTWKNIDGHLWLSVGLYITSNNFKNEDTVKSDGFVTSTNFLKTRVLRTSRGASFKKG